MKSRSASDEYVTFALALRKVVGVSRAEMQARIQAEKKARKGRRGRPPSSRASRDKG